ncbi:MAG TPA: Ig-like domain-containing protein, partial [Mycobacterium sp.]|nr:Ig-like domain-containing protein [Mycobacterium sp.]
MASIAITPATSSIQSGQKQQLVATGTDDNGRTIKNLNVKWSSSNPALASVTGNGLVTGIAKGTCVITAQVQGRRATATVTVLDVPVATVAVTLGAAQIAVGQTTQASVTLKDASGSPITGRTVAWQSSNPAMATVNASGLVTALAKSAVTISAIADAKVGSASLTINAAVPASIAITPSALSVTIGQSGQ